MSTYSTNLGYLTETIRQKYIASAIASGTLPKNAHRMEQIISLTASKDTTKPIQFWQLFSVLGQEGIVTIVSNFYQRVFGDEDWFRLVFERVGGINHHINTQASMWIDVMGGGPYYHGAEFRLNFHHTHNAELLMNEKGAKRWVKLMVETLDDSTLILSKDPRIRPAINTFLDYFVGKYANDFNFKNQDSFGQNNPPVKVKISFMNMTNEAIEALSEDELKEALKGHNVDITKYRNKSELISKALSL